MNNQQTLVNNYAEGIEQPINRAEDAFFFISTITSGICIGTIFAMFLLPEASIKTAFDSVYSASVWIVSIIVGLAIAGTIDFVVIRKIGMFAMLEMSGWISGFAMPAHRKINALMVFSVFVFGFAVSFITSWDGSSIVAGMAPTFTPPSLHSIATSERANIASSIAPHQKSIAEIEQKIVAQTSAIISPELKRLSKQGNAWAIAESQAISNKVSNKYAKELAKAKESLTTAENREHNRADKILQDAEATKTTVTAQNDKKTTIVWKLLAAIGTLPLIFGVLIMFIKCNNKILLQKPKFEPKVKAPLGPRAVSADDEFKKLYGGSNP